MAITARGRINSAIDLLNQSEEVVGDLREYYERAAIVHALIAIAEAILESSEEDRASLDRVKDYEARRRGRE